jgi:hypothetical protein
MLKLFQESGEREWGREAEGGIQVWYTCKNLCKCCNVPTPSTTILKKGQYWLFLWRLWKKQCVLHFFLPSRDYPQSLACGLILHLQSQQCHIFVSYHSFCFLFSWLPQRLLWLYWAYTVNLGLSPHLKNP